MTEKVVERRALADPSGRASEPFRTLRLALQLGADKRRGNVVLVTGAEPRVGKSVIAANYALLSSLNHTNVLLIDSDLRAPTLHASFGVPREPGLVELLASGGDIDQFVRHVPTGELDVLTAGRPIPRTSDLASSRRMRELLEEASDRYDLVVADSPPVLAAADAEGLASHPGVDVVVVVSPRTRRRSLQKALRKLELVEANVIGLILNESGKPQRAYEGYGRRERRFRR